MTGFLFEFPKHPQDWFFSHCPYNLLYAMAGLVICFFGGMFPALLAALEAFQQVGRSTV